MMGKRKITEPVHFRIGQRSDNVRKVLERRGIEIIRTAILNRDEVQDTKCDPLVVRWHLSNGTKLKFERRRLLDGTGAKCYRVTEVVCREQIGKRSRR